MPETDDTAPEPRVSLWDRLVVPYYTAGLVHDGAPEELARRRAARTAGFDDLLARLEQTEDRRERLEICSRVVAEHRRRLASWARWQRNWLKDEDLARWMHTLTGVGPGASASLLLWGPLAALLAWTRRSAGFGTMARLARALDRGHCPDCRYDLTRCTVPPAWRGYGAWIGPERCPECGAPWPLLPPLMEKPRGRSA